MDYDYKAEVIGVHDGDTYTLKMDLGFKIFHEIKVRMLGIDTPEVRAISGRYKFKEEITLGKQIGAWVSNRILGKTVEVKTYKDDTDVYGRYLIDLFYEVDGQMVHLNQQMLDLGFDKTIIQEKLESSTTIEISAE